MDPKTQLTADLDTYLITVKIDTGKMDHTNCDNNLVFQKVCQSFVSIYDTNPHNSNYIFQPISLRGDVCDQKLASLGTILLTCQYHARKMCIRGYRFCHLLRFFNCVLELLRQCGIVYFFYMWNRLYRYYFNKYLSLSILIVSYIFSVTLFSL